MTTQRRFELITAAVVLAFALCFLRGWMLSRDAAIRADARAQADEQTVATAQQAIRDRDALAAQYNATLSAQASAIRTPQQAAQVILRYLPPAPAGQPAQPPIVTIDRSTLPPDVQKQYPDAPQLALVAPTQLQQLAKDELACDATRHDLATCRADTHDLHLELDAKTDEAATWQAAAKGGTKWQRFGRVLKAVGCAAGGAGVGALASKQDPRGAAIGAGAGVAACSLF